MKRYLPIAVLVILMLVGVAVAGCGDEATTTTMGEMQDTTTMPSESTTTTMAETMTTSAPMTTAPPTTATTMGGSDLPMAQPGTYTDLTPQQAKQLIDTTPDLVIIDVSPHYDEGHLPGAVSYYLGDGSLEKAIPMLDKNVPYLVYCHVDAVAISGAEALVDAGFTMVYRLEGNYSGWVNAGLPVEK